MKELLRERLGEKFWFVELAPTLYDNRKLAEALRGRNDQLLPAGIRDELINSCRYLTKKYDECMAFQPEPDRESSDKRKQLIADVKQVSQSFYQKAWPLLAAGPNSAKVKDFQQLFDNAESKLKTMESMYLRAESIKVQLERLFDSASETANAKTVAAHAKHYMARAEDFDKAARWWLGATAVLFVLTVGGSVYLYLNGSLHVPIEIRTSGDSATHYFLLQRIASKVILLSIMISAVIWCGRIYRANRHNAVLNRHRQHSLETFQTFVDAQTDVRTREAILLQSTACIFAHQSPGFVGGDAEGTASPNTQILEIIRGMGGQNSK